MRRIARWSAMLACLAWTGDALAQTVWQCEVSKAYGLAPNGSQGEETSPAVGKRFTANDDTGEVTGDVLLGTARDWKKLPRRYGPDQDGLQSVRGSGERLLMHLYVETFATGPVKPFLLSELDIGASRTGTCRAAR